MLGNSGILFGNSGTLAVLFVFLKNEHRRKPKATAASIQAQACEDPTLEILFSHLNNKLDWLLLFSPQKGTSCTADFILFYFWLADPAQLSLLSLNLAGASGEILISVFCVVFLFFSFLPLFFLFLFLVCVLLFNCQNLLSKIQARKSPKV